MFNLVIIGNQITLWILEIYLTVIIEYPGARLSQTKKVYKQQY